MKILFVHNQMATFTRIDWDILCAAHEVRELHVRRTSPGRLLADNTGVVQQVRWADLVFAWFGGYHALLPFALGRAMGRPCVIVASGYDVADMPEIGYGNMRRGLRPGLRRTVGRQVFALADRVLAVSEFARSEAMRNAGVPAAKLQVILHGLDAGRLQPGAPGVRQRQVLSVGSVTPDMVVRKGFREYVTVAAHFPDVPFSIIGPQDAQTAADLRRMAPPNVHLLGPVYDDALTALMQQSAVYAQLSAYESFGMALAEAMLCGCIPVVTDRGALPEVVGPAGSVVPYGDLAAYARALEGALAAPPEAREAARCRITAEFPLERRRQALLHALEEVRADGAATR